MQSGNYIASDLLEGQFGKCTLEIIAQDPLTRLVTISLAETSEVLEVAHTTFAKEGIAAFSSIHAKVLDGEFMGKVFKMKGVPFFREVESLTNRAIPKNIARAFGEDDFTVILVNVYVGFTKIHYAQIIEIYHPKVTF